MVIWQRKRMIFNGFLTLRQVKQTTYVAFYETIDTTIMGRKTYQEAKKYLETEAIYPEKKNFVFSTNAQLQLPDAEVVHEEPVAFLKNLQMTEGKDIWVVGGGSIDQTVIGTSND